MTLVLPDAVYWLTVAEWTGFGALIGWAYGEIKRDRLEFKGRPDK